MTKKEDKKDKKKLLVLALFLFAVVGLAGYGVYSYYWTQGSYDADSNTIEVASFDPETTISDSDRFLGEGGSVTLSCPSSSNGKETITCTGSLNVKNKGGTAITVDVLEASATEYSKQGDFTTSVGDPRFNWTSTTISAGESETLTIEVSASVDNGTQNGLESSEEEYVSQPVPGGSFEVQVDFKLKATQVRN